MRRKVPFVGEEKIERADDENAPSKKARGRVIDDVLSADDQGSSWDDVVVKTTDDVKSGKVNASLAKKSYQPVIPIGSGAASQAKNGSSIAVNGVASIDWVPINNGHGMRINVCGSLDQNIREEWHHLLDETSNNGVNQFEFNMTQAASISLAGLGMLLLFREQKGSERGDIKLCHCNKDVGQILQWTGMDKYFTIQ